MTMNLNITASTTTGIGNDYPVLTERLVQIDGIDYVRCELHGLIPLLHECSASPGDHWCREAAHPNYDPADGDQATSHREWDRIQSAKVHRLTEALLRACLYLDGFVWLADPEASELDDIKETCAQAMGLPTWDEAVAYAKRRDEARG